MNVIEAIEVNYQTVTPEMIGACTKILSNEGNFWKVMNSRGDLDGNGEPIEYTVKAIQKNGKWFVTCDCPRGSEGGRCWHKRATQTAEAELKAAMVEQVALNEAPKKVEPVAAKPRKTRKFDEGEALYRSRMRGIADILAVKQMATTRK